MAAAAAPVRLSGGPPPIATFPGSTQVVIPRWLLLIGLIIGQGLLARFMSQQPRIGLVQAVLIVGLFVYAALKRNTPLTLCLLAYLPAAEITWRQAQVEVPYLTAPYLCIFVSLLAMGTTYNHLTRSGRTALLYLGLLVPAILVTLSATGANSRELIVFALSGPFALGGLVLFFSQLTILPWLYRRMLWCLLISGIGPLAIALTAINDYIVNVGEVQFNSESNPITSGGFGPVQVSSVMGLTVLVAVLLLMVEQELVPRILACLIGLLAMVQSLLTFSRGGMTATAIAAAGLALSQATNPQTRRRVLIVIGIVFLVGYYVVFPRVDAFTKGKLDERFSSAKTGRTTLAQNDLQLFRQHILFGVGPGMSKYRTISYEVCQYRSDKCAYEGSSHTEFTRLPAEHGLPGVAAIVVMLALGSQALRRAGPSFGLSLTMLLWSVAQMFYANLRVMAVPFTFAFAFILVREPEPPPPPDDELAEARAAGAIGAMA